MKIFILRHEDRTQDASFFAPLTKTGLENSNKLIETIEKNNITQIYSSPYIRTLQTIYPFSKKRGKKIKLEYSLAEINHPDLIAKNSYGVRLPEYMSELFNYDSSYTSQLEVEEIKYPETESDVEIRIKNFLKNLITQHGKYDDNILLVTHQVVCSNILKIVSKSNSVNKDSIANYQKGAITLIFDNLHWTFKPMNWKVKEK
jgi:broad specificity phosphatase PhoE